MAQNQDKKTQQAWIVQSKGQPQKAIVKKEWPIPSALSKDEVLVKVQAAALNPVGYKLLTLLPNFIAKRPLPAEYDLAGVIEDPNGSSFNKGDEVFGIIPVPLSWKTREGALQQYAKVPAKNLVIRPNNITPTEASGIALAGETAWQSLFNVGKLEAGQTVFINGGSSSVGAFAIQIAKANGAKVVASASGKNEEYVRRLGADEFVDYTKEPLHEYLEKNPPSTKYHLFLDAAGLAEPDLYIHSPAYLAPGGIFANTLGGGNISSLLRTAFWILRPTWLGGVPRPFKIVAIEHSQSDLQAMADLLAEGKIKPIVDSVHSFDDVHKAYERIMTGRATGKVVVKVDPTVA